MFAKRHRFLRWFRYSSPPLYLGASVLLNMGVSRVTALERTHCTAVLSSFGIRPDILSTTCTTRENKTSSVALRIQNSHHRVRSTSTLDIQRDITLPLGLRVKGAPRVISFTLQLGPSCVYVIPRGHRRVAARNNLSTIFRRGSLTPAVTEVTSGNVRIDLFVSPRIPRIRTTTHLNTPVVRLRAKYFTGRSNERHARRLTHLGHTTRLTRSLNVRIGTNRNVGCRGLRRLLTNVPYLRRLGVNRAVMSHTLFIKVRRTIERVHRTVSHLD